MSEKMTVTGCCRYCGQANVVMIPKDNNYTESDIDTLASSQCDCQMAAETKAREKRSTDASESIDEIFPEVESVRDFLKMGAHLIAVNEIDKLTVKIDEVTSAKLNMTPKGKIRIERIRKNSAVKES